MQPKPAVSCDQPVGILKTFQGTAWQGCLIYVYIYYRRARGGHVRQICASGKRCIRHMKWVVVILELMFRGGHSRLHLWLCAESEKPKCSKQNIYNLLGMTGGGGNEKDHSADSLFGPFCSLPFFFVRFCANKPCGMAKLLARFFYRCELVIIYNIVLDWLCGPGWECLDPHRYRPRRRLSHRSRHHCCFQVNSISSMSSYCLSN